MFSLWFRVGLCLMELMSVAGLLLTPGWRMNEYGALAE